MNCQEAKVVLHPYLDQELDLTNAVAVEAHIGQCAECALQYSRLRRLRQEIAAADLAYSPRPELERVLIARYRKQSKPAWSFGWQSISLAAATVSLLAVFVILPSQLGKSSAWEGELVDSHMRSLIAGHLVDVPSSDQHTVKPWFQGRIDFAPSVPDLKQEGFPLVGGRLDVLGQKQAAAIVYTRRAHVINVFIVAGESTGPRQSSTRGYNVIAWTQAGLSYWAVSDLNAAELSQFVSLLRR